MDTAETIAQFAKMLKNVDRWLEAGTTYAEKKKFEPDVLARSRLAPDQYDLTRQVQSACDAAKYAAAYYYCVRSLTDRPMLWQEPSYGGAGGGAV